MTPSSNASHRTELPLSFCYGSGRSDECITTGYVPSGKVTPRNAALIRGQYKLIIGTQNGFGVRVGPSYPNNSHTHLPQDPGCPSGCLYDILADPGEYTDLKSSEPQVFQELMDR